MAKLRQNHTRQGNGLQSSFRMVILVFVLLIALVAGYYFLKNNYLPNESTSTNQLPDYSLRTYLPTYSGELVHHTYYSLSYLEKYEQAEWVAYVMDRTMLNVPNLSRFGRFDPDDAVTTRSANHNDYSNSGYTRGHLAPAGDMAFDSTAMRESFLMSNISPQIREFNNGVWKELEENVRDWTYKAGKLYIITGPIFTGSQKTIGKDNKIAIPDAFFKVLLDYEDTDKKAIGFIIPNTMSTKRLEEYMTTVDEIEKITGLDFFNDMINDDDEERLESVFDKRLWSVSDKRYQLRIERWNYEK